MVAAAELGGSSGAREVAGSPCANARKGRLPFDALMWQRLPTDLLTRMLVLETVLTPDGVQSW
jgi:hypothetical protein